MELLGLPVRPLLVAAALGCGLAAGVFFAFSTFVMRGLDRLPPAEGLRAMQSINVTAVSPLFMLALFGTALLCLVLGVWSLGRLDTTTGALVLAASALYLVGVVGLTIGYHVPHNDALAGVQAGTPGADAAWRDYSAGWTAWNHVRTVAPLIASGLLVGALSAA